MKNLIIVFIAVMISPLVHAQSKPTVVASVDLERYQGFWYEIARLPFYFERKLKCTSATYTLREDGKITVLNQGHFITDPLKVDKSEGVAWIPDKNSPSKLKVRFFWPFAGDYWIMHLDKEYKYVLIGEPGLKYLWILAREKKMDEQTYNMLLQKAVDNGYDVKQIIRTEQDCEEEATK